ncbi:MAG TPA: hypothetical protein VD926_07810 [Acidimicrobiales bacterium]|nr:hypothetical protein [Acidimicrobiales bacterium]
MGCCAAVLAAWISPRFVLFLIWLFGDRLDIAFDSFWTGFAGFLFLPWTTLAFAFAYAPQAEVSGIGWLVVGLALAFDLSTWFGGDRERRRRGRR